MKKTIKTYKNFEDFQEDDIINVYYNSGKLTDAYKEQPFRIFHKDTIKKDFNNNLIEVVKQAKPKCLTWEYTKNLTVEGLNNLKVYHSGIEDSIVFANDRGFKLKSFYDKNDTSSLTYWFTDCDGLHNGMGATLNPPPKELIEVVPPWVVEEPKKKSLKVRFKDYSSRCHWSNENLFEIIYEPYEFYHRIYEYRLYHPKATQRSCGNRFDLFKEEELHRLFDIVTEDSSKWFVKSIKGIVEVESSSIITLEEL